MSAEPGRALRLRADLALLGLTVLWSATFVLVKDALDEASPFAFLAARFFVGAAALSLVAGRDLLHRPSVRAGLLLSAFLFGGFALQTTGLARTTPARSAFITGLAVLFVPLLSVAVHRRLPRLSTQVGVLVATLGLVLFTRVFDGASGPTLTGDLLTLAGAVSFSVHQLLNERFAREVRPAAAVAVQLWLVAAGALAMLPTEHVTLPGTVPVIGAVVFCGLFASAFAISVQTWAQRHTSAVRAALIFTLEPLFAAAGSVALGRETLDVSALGGGALMLLGVAVAELWPALPRRVAAPEDA